MGNKGRTRNTSLPGNRASGVTRSSKSSVVLSPVSTHTPPQPCVWWAVVETVNVLRSPPSLSAPFLHRPVWCPVSLPPSLPPLDWIKQKCYLNEKRTYSFSFFSSPSWIFPPTVGEIKRRCHPK